MAALMSRDGRKESHLKNGKAGELPRVPPGARGLNRWIRHQHPRAPSVRKGGPNQSISYGESDLPSVLPTRAYEIAETYRNVIQGGRPLFSFPRPFPDDLSRADVPSQSVSGYPLETNEGTIHQFNATVERELGNIGVRLSYIGSRSRGQNYAININKPQPSLTPFTESLRPYQFVEAIVRRNDGRARFNSVQVEAQKRAGWFQFDAHYTWSSNWNNYLDWLSLENPYVPLHWDASFTVGVTISNLFNSPHFYNPSGDITSSSVARFQSVIGATFPTSRGGG
jgi:hypothetical protein